MFEHFYRANALHNRAGLTGLPTATATDGRGLCVVRCKHQLREPAEVFTSSQRQGYRHRDDDGLRIDHQSISQSANHSALPANQANQSLTQLNPVKPKVQHGQDRHDRHVSLMFRVSSPRYVHYGERRERERASDWGVKNKPALIALSHCSSFDLLV